MYTVIIMYSLRGKNIVSVYNSTPPTHGDWLENGAARHRIKNVLYQVHTCKIYPFCYNLYDLIINHDILRIIRIYT